MNRLLIRRIEHLPLKHAARDWGICAAASLIATLLGSGLGLHLPLYTYLWLVTGLLTLIAMEAAISIAVEIPLHGSWLRPQRILISAISTITLINAVADPMVHLIQMLGLAALLTAVAGALFAALDGLATEDGAGTERAARPPAPAQRVIVVDSPEAPSSNASDDAALETSIAPCGRVAINLSGSTAEATCSLLAHQADQILDAAHAAGAQLALFRDEPWPAPLRELALLLHYGGLGVVTRDALHQQQQGIAVLPTGHASETFLQPPFHHARRRTLAVKRLVDIALSSVALVLVAPVLALAALAIGLDSPGPIIYRQIRTGRNKQPFSILKFRTMCIDAERDGAPRWASRADPRITRVGRLLRRTRIDELPQFVNVLRGEMSLVGPRPERPEFVELLRAQITGYEFRHLVRPGLTGWAQINYPYGASVEDARAKLGFDLYYIRECTVRLDLAIMARTLRVVVRGEGV